MSEPKNSPINTKKIINPYKIFEIKNKLLFKKKLLRKNLLSSLSISKKFHSISPDISKRMKQITLSDFKYKKYISDYDKITKENSFKSPGHSHYPKIKNIQYIPILYSHRKKENNYINKKNLNDNTKTNNNFFNITNSINESTNCNNFSHDNLNKEANIIETPYGFKYKNTKIITNIKKYINNKDNIDNKDNNNQDNNNQDNNKNNSKDNKYYKINNINTFKYKYFNLFRHKEKEFETKNNNFFLNLSDGCFFENKNNINKNDIYNSNSKNSNVNDTIYNNYNNSEFKCYDIKYSKDENKEYNLIKENNISFLYEEMKKMNLNLNNIYNKKINFSIKSEFNKNINFILEIKNIFLEFIEINPEDNFKNIKKQKIFFPFYYLPFFYLLDFISFKCFISEIIIYDPIKNIFKINSANEIRILNKYSENGKKYFKNFSKIKAINKLNLFNDITYNLNENNYNTTYDWCIYNKNDNTLCTKLFKMKIILPRIKLSINEQNIKIRKNINKNLMIELLKNDFQNWNKYILFDLFIHKKFRLIINNILLHKFDLYTNKKIYLDKNNDYNNFLNYIKHNYEFYITNIDLNYTKFFYFLPNTAILAYVSQYKNIQTNFIQLSIRETNNIKRLSKCLGIDNILLKCLYLNKEKNEITLNMNVIENISDDFIKIVENENLIKNINIKNNNNENEIFHYIYNDYEINILLRNPKIININMERNKIELFYHDIPELLLDDILNNNRNEHTKYLYNSLNEIVKNVEKVDENYIYDFNQEIIYLTNGESLTKKDFERILVEKRTKTSNNLLLGKLSKKIRMVKNYTKLFSKNTKMNKDFNLFDKTKFNLHKISNNINNDIYTSKK